MKQIMTLDEFLKDLKEPKNREGMGLPALRALCFDIVESKAKTICEFGSGYSTRVLVDLNRALNLGLLIDSFEHDSQYLPTVRDLSLCLRLRPLDSTGFYTLDPADLRDTYDYVILDGPIGEPRSRAFEIMRNHVHPGTRWFVHDSNHFTFQDDLIRVFPVEIILHDKDSGKNREFIICAIIGDKHGNK